VKNLADQPLDYWITRDIATDAPDLHLPWCMIIAVEQGQISSNC